MNKKMRALPSGGGVLGQGAPRLLWGHPLTQLPLPQTRKAEAAVQGWPPASAPPGQPGWGELHQGGAGTWAQGGGRAGASPGPIRRRTPSSGSSSALGSEAWELQSRGTPGAAPPAMPPRPIRGALGAPGRGGRSRNLPYFFCLSAPRCRGNKAFTGPQRRGQVRNRLGQNPAGRNLGPKSPR